MSGLLGVAPGAAGSGRERYGRAMALYRSGGLSAAQLEAYRVAAADDARPPREVLEDRGLPVPADTADGPEAALRRLIAEADLYLAGLPGPGVAEVRLGLSRWQAGPFAPVEMEGNAVVDTWLDPALNALRADCPALAAAIAAAAPVLRWITYDGYPPADIGTGFAEGHAYAVIVGQGGPVAATDFDLGLFLVAPHVLYRDHHHAAPELYAPLTGPHGWRFGPGTPLVVKPAHQPVWNPPHHPHLTKVGPVPFLCLFGWTRDTAEPAHVIPAKDWPELEELRLG